MFNWYVGVIKIEYQNRYVKCIFDTAKNIVCECEALSDSFINDIIKAHNLAIESAMEFGAKIRQEVENR